MKFQTKVISRVIIISTILTGRLRAISGYGEQNLQTVPTWIRVFGKFSSLSGRAWTGERRGATRDEDNVEEEWLRPSTCNPDPSTAVAEAWMVDAVEDARAGVIADGAGAVCAPAAPTSAVLSDTDPGLTWLMGSWGNVSGIEEVTTLEDVLEWTSCSIIIISCAPVICSFIISLAAPSSNSISTCEVEGCSAL